MREFLFITLTILLSFSTLLAQESKNITREAQAWFQYFNRTSISKKTLLTVDFGVRRRGTLEYWAQAFGRVGALYTLKGNARIGGGIAYFYDYTIPKPEIRPYQELTMNNKDMALITVGHRFRLEERYNLNKSENGYDSYNFNYRFRYRIHALLPLGKPSLTEDTYFLQLDDEIFLNIGKSIVNNVFDRNRLGFGAGYMYSKNLSFTLSYVYQFIQNAKVNDYQQTDIIWFSIYHNLDLLKVRKQIPTLQEDQVIEQ